MSTTTKPPHGGRILFCSATGAVGGFLFGFDSAVINGTVGALESAFGANSVGTGFSVASMLLGCALGALLAGSLADRFGRKPMMTLSALMFLVSALGSGWATTSEWFIVFRLLGGFAVGAASVIAPAYIAEIAPPKTRGRLGSLQQLAIVLGIFIAFLSNYFIAKSAGGAGELWWGNHAAWRWMFWVEAVPSVLYFLLLFFLPESPRFLVARGRDEKARQVMDSFGMNADATVAAIHASLSGDHKPRLSDLLVPGTARLLPIVWIGIALAALQQLSGINVIFYYGSVLWQAAGFSESDALFINIISGAINIGSTFVAMAMIDRVGRRPLLLGGAAFMAITLASVALIFGLGSTAASGELILSPAAAKAALIAAHLYLIGFAVTWGPCLWVVLGEMFANRIRGSAMALATFMLWMANFAITMSFPPMLCHLGLGGSYAIYTGFALLSFLMVLRFVRETKGRSLETVTSR